LQIPRVVVTRTFADYATIADVLAHRAEVALGELRRGGDITLALKRLRAEVRALSGALDDYVPNGVAARLAARAVRNLEHCSGLDPFATEAGLVIAVDTLGELHLELDEASAAVGAR
jgi:hypothetical protein